MILKNWVLIEIAKELTYDSFSTINKIIKHLPSLFYTNNTTGILANFPVGGTNYQILANLKEEGFIWLMVQVGSVYGWLKSKNTMVESLGEEILIMSWQPESWVD